MISVLVVYASFGEGHKKAAEAIGDFFDVPTCDLLDFTHPLVRYAYQKGYIFITQHLPTFWKFIFFLARWNSFSKIAHYFQNVSQFGKVWKSFTGENPDITELTDEIAKLRPMVMCPPGLKTIYAVDQYEQVVTNGIGYFLKKNCRLATAQELQEISNS